MAEVCGVTETPGKSDLSNALFAERVVLQIFPTSFQSQGPNVVSWSVARGREEPMQVAHGNSHGRCHLARPQRWFREMSTDVSENSSAQLRTMLNERVVDAKARGEDVKVSFECGRALLLSHPFRFVIEGQGQPEQLCSRRDGSANLLRDGNIAQAHAALHNPARHTQVKPHAVAAATGGPRFPGVNQCAVTRSQ